MRGRGRPEYLTRKLTGRDGGQELGSGGRGMPQMTTFVQVGRGSIGRGLMGMTKQKGHEGHQSTPCAWIA